MKVGPVPQSLTETLAMAAGAVPRPVFDTLLAAGLARTLMAATRVGIFEELATGARDAQSIAQRCRTDLRATEALLTALQASGYLERGAGGYALTSMARKWMLGSSARSLRDHMLLMYLAWRWLEHYETFLETGEALDVHEVLPPEDWQVYQRGMRSLASLSIDEFVLRTPVPRNPKRMIDIGGSHGLYAAALCRRHRALQAEILDLPDATEHARTMVEHEGLGERLVQRSGDARDYDFGVDRYDVVLLSNLVHHFDEKTNADLVHRIARALRRGGVLLIQEPFRGLARADDQVGCLGAFYFASLSASGTWTVADAKRWATTAGLTPKRPLRFITVPGFGQVTCKKP